MHDMTSSADWTGVRPVTEKMPAAVLARGEQVEINSPIEMKTEIEPLSELRDLAEEMTLT
jgi:hypothetical protein